MVVRVFDRGVCGDACFSGGFMVVRVCVPTC